MDVTTVENIPHGSFHSSPILALKTIQRFDDILEILSPIIGKAVTFLNIGDTVVFGMELPLTKEPSDIHAITDWRRTWLARRWHRETEVRGYDKQPALRTL
jgi:hypothetical protein